jgi:hypothetical protein
LTIVLVLDEYHVRVAANGAIFDVSLTLTRSAIERNYDFFAA